MRRRLEGTTKGKDEGGVKKPAAEQAAWAKAGGRADKREQSRVQQRPKWHHKQRALGLREISQSFIFNCKFLFIYFFLPRSPSGVCCGGPVSFSVVVGQPLCFRGLDLHLSLLGLGLIHLPPVGPLEEATLGEEGARLDHRLHSKGTE